MAARGSKFSFMRLINNAVPSFARDDHNDVDLSPLQADALVAHQLSLPSPLHLYLDPAAFLIAQITDSQSTSAKIHKALLKAGIIAAAPEGASSKSKVGLQEGAGPTSALREPVTTTAIKKNFANQLAVISVHAQRKLVGLLFFWEEECTRFKLLDAEEQEIWGAMAARAAVAQQQGGGEGRLGEGQVGIAEEGEGGEEEEAHQMADLEVALEAVRMRRRLLPSQRAEGTANVGAGKGRGELPAYT